MPHNGAFGVKDLSVHWVRILMYIGPYQSVFWVIDQSIFFVEKLIMGQKRVHWQYGVLSG